MFKTKLQQRMTVATALGAAALMGAPALASAPDRGAPNGMTGPSYAVPSADAARSERLELDHLKRLGFLNQSNVILVRANRRMAENDSPLPTEALISTLDYVKVQPQWNPPMTLRDYLGQYGVTPDRIISVRTIPNGVIIAHT